VVRTQVHNYSKKAHHTEINNHAVHTHIGAHLADYSISVRYADLTNELVKLVTIQYTKKLEKMNADAEQSNKKMIKDLINSHLKIVEASSISYSRCMTELQQALPHIPDGLWQAAVYGAFVRDLIDEHKAKINTKSMKALQNGVDKGMEKQLREFVIKYAKTTEVEKISKSLCKAYLIAEVKDDCGCISRYDHLINDVS